MISIKSHSSTIENTKHTKIFLSHLHLGINIPPLTANRHGYRIPIDLLEQLPTYALVIITNITIFHFYAFLMRTQQSNFNSKANSNVPIYSKRFGSSWYLQTQHQMLRWKPLLHICH